MNMASIEPNPNQPMWMSNKTKQDIRNKHKIRKEKGPKSAEYKIAKAESKKLFKKDKIKQIQDDIEKLSYNTVLLSKSSKQSLKISVGVSKTEMVAFLPTKKKYLKDQQSFMKNFMLVTKCFPN